MQGSANEKSGGLLCLEKRLLGFPRWQQVWPKCPGASPLCSHGATRPPPGPRARGGGGGGVGAAIWPRALPQSKSHAHVTIGSGLMKLSTDGYFVVVL